MTPSRRDSHATRDAILNAARARFLREGFAGTTTRAVAGDVGVDAALVSRYFGSKQGLWEAALAIDLDLPSLSDVPASDLGRRLATEFVARWEGDQSPSLRLALSAAPTHSDAAAVIRTVFDDQVRPAIRAVVADRPDDRGQMVVAALLGMATCRYVLQLPGVADRPADDIVSLLTGTLQHCLTGDLSTTIL